MWAEADKGPGVLADGATGSAGMPQASTSLVDMLEFYPFVEARTRRQKKKKINVGTSSRSFRRPEIS